MNMPNLSLTNHEVSPFPNFPIMVSFFVSYAQFLRILWRYIIEYIHASCKQRSMKKAEIVMKKITVWDFYGDALFQNVCGKKILLFRNGI